MKKIVINPLTRISGFLEIEVEMNGNTVHDAKSSGLLYRGFEKMLEQRSPLDAVYFTERICGICSTAHAYAAAIALEQALNIEVTDNDRLIRDFIHGCEFLQNHLRHFYLYTFPDFVRLPEIEPISDNGFEDYRLPDHLNKRLSLHYLEAVKYSRLAHKMLAILGAKAPHNHGIFVGGVTVEFDSSKFIELKSILSGIHKFIDEVMIEDMEILSEYYEDYYLNGRGYGNFISYGLFSSYQDPELFYCRDGVMIHNKIEPFNQNLIKENITHAWYDANRENLSPLNTNFESNVTKIDAYSFVKAPRYNGYALETGPLARMWLSGSYRKGISTMDRVMARVLETKKIADIMTRMLSLMVLKPPNQNLYQIPDEAIGIGLIDTTRGALGHFLQIKERKIDKYTIITPTSWNLSPTDNLGIKGVTEAALIGLNIRDEKKPVEVGRVVRSFDPCVSCATHITGINNDITVRVV